MKLLIFKTRTCHLLRCSLHLVVLSEEINGLDEAALSVKDDISVLTDPVSKVELEVGLSNPVNFDGVINPVPAEGDG